MKYKILCTFFSLILISCKEDIEQNNSSDNVEIRLSEVFSFPNEVGILKEIRLLSSESELFLIKEPVIMSTLNIDSVGSKSSMFLEDIILRDTSLSKSDLDFMNLQSSLMKNISWDLPDLKNIISERSIDSVKQSVNNYIILKMSFPIFNRERDKAYLKSVLLTNSSLSGNLVKYEKKKGKWIIVYRRQI